MSVDSNIGSNSPIFGSTIENSTHFLYYIENRRCNEGKQMLSGGEKAMETYVSGWDNLENSLPCGEPRTYHRRGHWFESHT